MDFASVSGMRSLVVFAFLSVAMMVGWAGPKSGSVPTILAGRPDVRPSVATNNPGTQAPRKKPRVPGDEVRWTTNAPGAGVRSFTQPTVHPNGRGPVSMQVEFSQPVLVARMPVIPFLFGGQPRYLLYRSGAGTSTLQFEYQPTEADAEGAVGALDPLMGQIVRLTGGAIITDLSGNIVQSIVDGADRLVVLGSYFKHYRTVAAGELDEVLDLRNPNELGSFFMDPESRTYFFQNPAKPFFEGYVPPTFKPAANGVEIYKVYYNSSIPSLQGRPTLASGFLAIPDTGAARMDLLSYQHGTVFSKQVVPSRSFDTETTYPSDHYWTYETRAVVAASGGQGMAVAAPDYFGLGDSVEFNAFVVKSANQQACLDLLEAVEGFLAARGIERGGLYLSGWSQGALVTMQFLEKLESLGKKVDGTGTAACPSAFLLTAQRALFRPRTQTTNETGDLNMSFAFILPAFACEHYYNRPGFARSVFNDKYYETARRIYEWNGDVAGALELFASIPPRPAPETADLLQLLRPEYQDPSYFSGSELAGFFRLVSAYDFIARSPVRSWNGEQDEALPLLVTQIPVKVQDIWNPGLSTHVPVLGGSHRGTFMRAVADQVDWFRSLPTPR